MKKILFAIFFVFLTSCSTSSNSLNNNSGTTETSISSVVVENTNLPTSTNVGEFIASDAGYAQCINTAKITCGNEFINSYALNNSNVEICNQFEDKNLQIACKEMVITETAKKTLDSDRCKALENEDKKAFCVQSVILEKWIKDSDPTVCSNYILSSTDTDTLENLKDRCVMHIIDQIDLTDKTKWLCGLIIDKDLKSSCEASVQERINFSQPVEQAQ